MPIKTEGNALTLRWAQGQVLKDKKRFVALLAGRRFGKSVLSIVKLLTAAIEKPGIYGYCAPTYRMAKEIAWDISKDLIPKKWIEKRHEGDLKISLINGSTIELKGVDNPDSLRGRSWDGMVLDECAFMPGQVWYSIIRPALSDRRGWCLFITTPSPLGTAGWWYELVLQLQSPDLADPTLAPLNPEDWSLYHFNSIQGGNIPKEEIEQARKELDDASFRREYMAEFFSLTGLVASEFSTDNLSAGAVDIPSLPLVIGVDFNNSPLSSVIGVVHQGQLIIHDEIVLTDATTWDLCDAIRERYGIERRIEVYPDPTGARKQTSGIGLGDHAILRRAGFRVVAPKAPYNVRDKIMAVNAALRTADGVIHTHIHPKCRELIKSLRSLGYKEGTDVPNAALGIDHSFDAFGYLCLGRFNLAKPKVSGRTDFRIY